MTRQAVTKHLDALRSAGLVQVTRRGRERLHDLDDAPLRDLATRLAPYAADGIGGWSGSSATWRTTRDRNDDRARGNRANDQVEGKPGRVGAPSRTPASSAAGSHSARSWTSGRVAMAPSSSTATATSRCASRRSTPALPGVALGARGRRPARHARGMVGRGPRGRRDDPPGPRVRLHRSAAPHGQRGGLDRGARRARRPGGRLIDPTCAAPAEPAPRVDHDLLRVHVGEGRESDPGLRRA